MSLRTHAKRVFFLNEWGPSFNKAGLVSYRGAHLVCGETDDLHDSESLFLGEKLYLSIG